MSHASGKKKGKKHEEEEHENHERWLVTYADMLTVLMALFIVLFALGTPNAKKLEAMAEGMANGLGGPVGVITGSTSVMKGSEADNRPLNLLTAVSPPTDGSVRKAVQAAADGAKLDQKLAARTEAKRLREIQKELEKALATQGIPEAARFRIDERGLVVSIVTDKVLFQADRAELQPGGRKVLRTVGPVLRKNPNGLLVEGHTNTAPVRPKFFASEWELSSMRASSVVRYLVTDEKISPKRMTAVGYADQHPLYGPENPRADELNRRVELIVQTTLPAESRGLLAGEAKADAAEEAAQAKSAAAVKAKEAAVPAAAPAEAPAEEHATEEHASDDGH